MSFLRACCGCLSSSPDHADSQAEPNERAPLLAHDSPKLPTIRPRDTRQELEDQSAARRIVDLAAERIVNVASVAPFAGHEQVPPRATPQEAFLRLGFDGSPWSRRQRLGKESAHSLKTRTPGRIPPETEEEEEDGEGEVTDEEDGPVVNYGPLPPDDPNCLTDDLDKLEALVKSGFKLSLPSPLLESI